MDAVTRDPMLSPAKRQQLDALTQERNALLRGGRGAGAEMMEGPPGRGPSERSSFG